MVILNIDTALQTASVCLSNNGSLLAFDENNTQQQHAIWLHQAIKIMLAEHNMKPADINAVSVSNGPGSYTGLRVGLSAAKGICYALNIPLICISTLQLMATTIVAEAEEYICPMIDARRMEVFTALYDKHLNLIAAPHALILSDESFSELLAQHKILFTGDGAMKFEKLITSGHATFKQQAVRAKDMISTAESMYSNKQFANLAYVEPEYVKAAYVK